MQLASSVTGRESIDSIDTTRVTLALGKHSNSGYNKGPDPTPYLSIPTAFAAPITFSPLSDFFYLFGSFSLRHEAPSA